MIFRNLTFLLLLVVIMFAGLTGCVVEKASEPKILLDEHHTENKVDIENNTGDGFVVFEEYRGFILSGMQNVTMQSFEENKGENR